MQKLPADVVESIRNDEPIADEKLEVVLGVAMKTISNYTNHIAGTELDAAFADFAWQKPSL